MNKRITEKEDLRYVVSSNAVAEEQETYSGKAIEKLGKFEDLYDYIIESQKRIEVDMAKLKEQGKEKSVTFNQQLAKKLANGNLIALFKLFNLEQ